MDAIVVTSVMVGSGRSEWEHSLLYCTGAMDAMVVTSVMVVTSAMVVTSVMVVVI